MIAYCNISLNYQITKACSAMILIHAFTVGGYTLDAKHSITKYITKETPQQVVAFLSIIEHCSQQ